MGGIPESKLPGFGTTIFTVMSKLAAEHGAINLSQGFPDFDPPRELRDRVAWHLDHGHNQYSPLAGIAELRQAIAGKVMALYDARVDPDTQVVVTPGATEALACAITAMVHPGDEVVIMDPAYDTYDPCVRLCGGIPRHVPMRTPGFSIDWDRVADTISDRTRLIMVNSPHNPTGSAWSPADIEALSRLVEDHDLTIVSDEVYEHIMFDDRRHESLLRHPQLASRSFVISSFGKTYHATGWRIGYCIAPPALISEFLRIHQFVNFSTNAPLQYAIADFLVNCPQHHLELGSFYQRKRDRFTELLAGTGFRLRPSAGTYFQLADYSGISDLPDTDFTRWLTTEVGVAAIPVSVFYRDPPVQRVVRFCFAKDDATLMQAADRLQGLQGRAKPS